MLLKFNLELLEKRTKQSWDLLDIFRDYYKGNWIILNNNKITSEMFKGPNFLLKASRLLADIQTDRLFIIQYIKLAARRNWHFYKDLGHKFLDLSYYPDLNLNAIKYNPLLIINDEKLYFKYEE